MTGAKKKYYSQEHIKMVEEYTDRINSYKSTVRLHALIDYAITNGIPTTELTEEDLEKFRIK